VNINRVCLIGNLTRDPELRALPSGTSVCKLRLAVNTRVKQDGEWKDKPNYFDVTVWAGQAESAAKYLHKGSQAGIDGRLEWREWEQDGNKRQAVEIVADTVQFLSSRDDSATRRDSSDVPSDFPSSPSNAPTDDQDEIPFMWEGSLEYEDRRGHCSRW
jgi:single-strand DNA-binding protein